MELSPQNERFVLHFGEMGSRWGVNRTVGQIYALLFLSPTPLNADDIAETLAFPVPTSAWASRSCNRGGSCG